MCAEEDQLAVIVVVVIDCGLGKFYHAMHSTAAIVLTRALSTAAALHCAVPVRTVNI